MALMSAPFEGGGTDGPDLACARSVAVVSRPRVSSKVAVCWEHRPARTRRRSPHVIDWFLRRADDIINRLADYHATGRATTRSPGRGSLRCKTNLPRNLAGTRQLIRAITIPAIGASLLPHLERCAARASPPYRTTLIWMYPQHDNTAESNMAGTGRYHDSHCCTTSFDHLHRCGKPVLSRVSVRFWPLIS